MSLSSYIFRKFLSSPAEALRLRRVGTELKNYIVWRLYTSLAESGCLSKLQERPWWSFKDKDLARLASGILAESGPAKRTGEAIQVTSLPEKTVIATQDAADLIPVIDRGMLALPQALEAGVKPNLPEESRLREASRRSDVQVSS